MLSLFLCHLRWGLGGSAGSCLVGFIWIRNDSTGSSLHPSCGSESGIGRFSFRLRPNCGSLRTSQIHCPRARAWVLPLHANSRLVLAGETCEEATSNLQSTPEPFKATVFKLVQFSRLLNEPGPGRMDEKEGASGVVGEYIPVIKGHRRIQISEILLRGSCSKTFKSPARQSVPDFPGAVARNPEEDDYR